MALATGPIQVERARPLTRQLEFLTLLPFEWAQDSDGDWRVFRVKVSQVRDAVHLERRKGLLSSTRQRGVPVTEELFSGALARERQYARAEPSYLRP